MAAIDRIYQADGAWDSAVQLPEAGPLVEIRIEHPPAPGAPHRSGGKAVLGYGLIDTGRQALRR